MHRERSGTPKNPQNQTISGIIVLGRVAAGERSFHASIRALEQRDQRPIGLEERLQKLELASGTPCDFRHRPLRVVVHENPYARIPVLQICFEGHGTNDMGRATAASSSYSRARRSPSCLRSSSNVEMAQPCCREV